MDYAKFYKDSNKTLVESLISLWVPGLQEEQKYIRELLLHKEPLIAPPVFQTIFPWKSSSETFEQHATKLHLFSENFVNSLGSIEDDEFAFPLNRKPYTHQTESWEALLKKKKTIVVTAGTGSGKTECFMLPVLQDLFLQKQNEKGDGVQAIFIYPLNALMKNQQKRIDAWCRALNPKITYAIYNGDTPDSLSKKKIKEEEAYPQLLSRKQIRSNPPQILFTNPTMLNYMLVRPEDQSILKQSKGKLRWILLDEAHTYSGSSAAELSLQIRRILDAFDVTVDQVNFALTSATMGDPNDPNTGEALKEFVGQITGKVKENIEIIDGERIVPELNGNVAQNEIDKVNAEYGSKATLNDIKGLRKKLNKVSSLPLKEICRVFNKKMTREEGLQLVNRLGDKVPDINADGTSGALLPTRIHLFVRSIGGMYACTNPNCSTHKAGRIDLGSLTTYQNTLCPSCKKPLLEIATCPHCGGLLLIGEQNKGKDGGFRLRVNSAKLDSGIFDYVSDDEDLEDDEKKDNQQDDHYSSFILAKEEKPCPRNNSKEQFFELDVDKSVFKTTKTESKDSFKECYVQNQQKITSVCPHCGENIYYSNLKYFRASATFLGRLLAPIILENAEPSSNKDDVDILYEGRKYITFTDSRQNTAKSAMSLNQDVERNWIRSAIYHKLCEIRLQDFNPEGGLSLKEQETYNQLKKMPTLPDMLQDMLDTLEMKRQGQSYPKAQPVSWDEIERSLEKSEDLKRMFKHLGEARLGGAKSGQDNNALNYLRALYVDQFGWIPKHSNSLETLGLVKVVYPPLKKAKVRDKLARKGFSDDDWQAFLKICLDYYIRGNRHYAISDSFSQFLTQTNFTKPIYASDSQAHFGNKKVSKWQTITLSEKGKVKERQNRLVLLLCAALGINSTAEMTQENIDLVNGILKDAWNFLTLNVLEMTDTEHEGFILDLIDKNKVAVQIIEKGYICPVDNVCVDTMFKGYSPRMEGYLSKANFERYKVPEENAVEYPYFPYPKRMKKESGKLVSVSDDEIYTWINDKLANLKDRGLLSSVMVNVYMLRPIFMAGEHSGQQQRQILDKYEDDFNKGHLNILSCSTTMEMGVDLKGISEVVMNDVPPKPANYLQRAGRAGRRQETKALALTFCAPNPIGMSAWNHPGWSMSHITEMSRVRLESIQIVQRQVNAYIFAKYVVMQGGIKVKSNIEQFFGGEPSVCDNFCNTLDEIINHQGDYSDWNKEYNRLVYGTVMSTTSLEDAAYKCKKQILFIKRDIYKQRVRALDKIIEDTEEASLRQRIAVANRKKVFVQTSLISWLAENNFLPSAGIPTGLVEFIPELSWLGKENAKMPTMHLSQAISSYAPGNKVVINEWCYQPSGITMKTRFDATKKNVIQYCDHCHYTTIVYGQPLTECPSCHHVGTMHGLKDMTIGTSNFTEIVEPSGFTVDWSSKPTRVLKSARSANFIQPILLEMEPWTESDDVNVLFKMRRSTPKSEILFYNKGKGYGYALCPYCGRMEAEDGFAGATGDKQPLTPHRHLIAGKECQGNDNRGANIRRNVLLVGRYQTDFVEIKFYDKKHHEVKDPSTLYSLGTIISRKLTEILGINEGEIDFGYNKSYDSIFIYDTALGGSGYSPLLFEYKDEVFKAAYDALDGCNCEKACTNCLIDRNTQWFINYLDRHKALEWLNAEMEAQEVPDYIRSAYGDAVKLVSDIHTELYYVLRANNVDCLIIFASNNLNNWNPELFPFAHNVKELHVNGVKVGLCINGKVDINSLSSDSITTIIPLLMNLNISQTERSGNGIAPLLMVKFKNGKQKMYFCENHYDEYNQDWGSGHEIYSTSMFVDDMQLKPVTPMDIVGSLRYSGHIVFESYVSNGTTTGNLLETITNIDRGSWNKICNAIPKGENVQLTYSDRYLKTPLGCILLAQLVCQLRKELGFEPSKATIMLPTGIISSGIGYYSNTESNDDIKLTDEFYSYKECDSFLQKCLQNICGISCEIIHERLPHYRSLTINGNSFELSIRPDGGVAYGWAVDNRSYPDLTLNDVRETPDQDFDLFNKTSRMGGILYTIAYKKK